LAIQLRRDVLPVLDAAGVDLVAVSIGTASRASDFVAETGFPSNRLFADPDAACYDALRLNRSLANFSQKSTPESLARRWREDGAKDLLDVLRRWKPWIPPKPEQGFQQGGAFVFDAEGRCAYRFYDPSTGVNAPFDDALKAAGIPPLANQPAPVPRSERNQ
jgi:peroxiredoxin